MRERERERDKQRKIEAGENVKKDKMIVEFCLCNSWEREREKDKKYRETRHNLKNKWVNLSF